MYFNWLKAVLFYKKVNLTSDLRLPAPTRALKWICASEIFKKENWNSLNLNSKNLCEIGLFLSTLIRYGEKKLVIDLSNWLCQQREVEKFISNSNNISIFSKAGILHGLLSVGKQQVEIRKDIEIIANDLFCRVREVSEKFSNSSSDILSIPLFCVLPLLIEVSSILNKSEYDTVVQNCMEHFTEQHISPSLLMGKHYDACELNALIDLGEKEKASAMLNNIFLNQSEGFSLDLLVDPAWRNLASLAQLSVCLYKIDRWKIADEIMIFLERKQTAKGNFFDDTCLQNDQLEQAWVAKAYLDAHSLRLVSFIERNIDIFPSDVAADDGRVEALLKFIHHGNQVIEVGCGKGRFLKVIRKIYPDVQCTGVDI